MKDVAVFERQNLCAIAEWCLTAKKAKKVKYLMISVWCLISFIKTPTNKSMTIAFMLSWFEKLEKEAYRKLQLLVNSLCSLTFRT